MLKDLVVIPIKINLALTVMLALAHVYILFFLPFILLPLSYYYALTLIPFCFMHSTQWGLIHEGIHKHLHPIVM